MIHLFLFDCHLLKNKLINSSYCSRVCLVQFVDPTSSTGTVGAAVPLAVSDFARYTHCSEQRALEHSSESNIVYVSVHVCVRNSAYMYSCECVWQTLTQSVVCCPPVLWVIWEPKHKVQFALSRLTFFIHPLIRSVYQRWVVVMTYSKKQWHNAVSSMDL